MWECISFILHGICYDFFFVTGQIYIDKKTSPDVRSQVQGLQCYLLKGLAFFLLGTQLSGLYVNTYGANEQLTLMAGGLFGLSLLVQRLFFPCMCSFI